MRAPSKTNHTETNMGYAVYVIADGASQPQIAAAGQVYRNALDDGLGGASQVKPCLRSWAKGKEHKTLTTQEDLESGAWIRAEHRARALATLQLAGATGIDFMVKLDS